EYEVARLQSDPAFLARLAEQFEGELKLRYHLAPPILAKRDAQGHLVKKAYGPWMLTAFRLLARFKGLRGTAFDPFGRTEERRTERALIGEYVALVETILAGLTPERLPLALELAKLPDGIRGYCQLNENHLHVLRTIWPAVVPQWIRPHDLNR
ncbi:DUF6537 domain-containing protein, partial [Burkholderia ambifaria]|uniref:DUF6537 domain-containing protein n=1 Tax=Burkholderia ambifaria TaxID=152480 RepID=UPI0031329D05